MAGRKINTMDEFAKVSDISRPTLSKYFNDPDSVRKTTRAKIEFALEEYDYRPNIFAINQNRKLTKTIGIVVPYLADPFFSEIVRRIERRCIDAGFWPIVFRAHALPSDTVLCSNDRLALGLIAAAYQKGLRVGHGPNCALRVAGHDDHPWSQFTSPPLTTVAQDFSAIAEKCAETLLGRRDRRLCRVACHHDHHRHCEQALETYVNG